MTGETAPVAEDTFRELVESRARELVRGADHVLQTGASPGCFTRPLLQELLSGAAEVEEILDAYGAARSLRWYPFRRVVATTKLFSQVAYQLAHILLFLPRYRLRPVGHDFRAETERALAEVSGILARTLDALIRTGRQSGLACRADPGGPDGYAEHLPPGRLPADRMSQKVTSPEQIVSPLATAFLNLSEDSQFIHMTQQGTEPPAGGWIPDPVNERALRDLEQQFHSLQSLYDTHISDTNVETLDRDLPVLRGHIAVTFHLLEICTRLAHYCERHILSHAATPDGVIVDHDTIARLMVTYSLAFTSRYILAARGLCHEMLKRYAVPDRVQLPIPKYRGFHVRPSTLVARIVAHYGSEVHMELDEETYNAGFTLDLFRANEKINAFKRRHLAREVHGRLNEGVTGTHGGMEEMVRAVAQRLFADGRLVIYDRALTLEGFVPREGESMEERVVRALTLLFSLGKVDVEMDIRATFRGDRRVLEDIRLLAESRYGEDDFGNNLPLPTRLSYLRR